MACFHVWCGFEGRHCDKCAQKAAGRAGGDVRYTLIQTLKAVGGIHNPEANASIIADAVIAALALPAPVVEGERFTGEQAWDELVNVDDRTSPEEYPDMCLITRDELIDFMNRAALSEDRSHG